MVMEEISLDDARKICEKKGLKPARVRGTEIVQFGREGSPRLEIISWDEFGRTLRERGLGIYEENGWLKIMKK